MTREYDVAVVGGGVVGCAIARELARHQVKVVLLERESDVARGTSGKNSGVVHTGFNVPTGSVKARLNVSGASVFEEFCAELRVPFHRVGKLVVALTEQEAPELEKLKAIGDANGVPSLEIVDGETVRRMEPNIQGYAALHVPTAAITCPFTLTIALAESAKSMGAEILFLSEVKRISGHAGAFRLTTGQGTVYSKLIVNSAGLYADHVARLAGVRRYKVYPCRGEYLIIDKSRSDLIQRMVYPVPPKGGPGLGVHLTPTVDGNILIGPSAAYVRHKGDEATTRTMSRALLREARELLPPLSPRDVVTSYSGIRSKTVSSAEGGFGDFIIEEAPELPGMMHLVGIESPGLTSAPAIAADVAQWVGSYLPLGSNGSPPTPSRLAVPFRELPSEQQAELVEADPDYGQIVCRCEIVTRREVLDAIHNPLGVNTLSGIKYRSRATMGRCQGGFCGPRIVEMLEQELGLTPEDISLKGPGSWLFPGTTKGLRSPQAASVRRNQA
ncbi:MAG: NAD(P)/FAD-dependent oxidoreductase [Dehalococcoidia bacterium]|jgi:glycerol-3-phosphate dehydrogenase|nr:NAD(P)/FAD-dependent oxidoreductase [Dehalococcoidia bacterium]MDP6229036.1 NAD(P)/FAD-dependent oxidoreductase [Dehalococcoidia bacterium]MDP7083395.1 NAD(P)/FAD-dependent oxidoreductase [Dehalococcoidia bacterium]MDP7200302.1 NAD(P)/FAD-dependent oxidoreductase [Dehalococcoidia bacterium]MDP7510889.1 NAD(P)/FAD-dependent oxidoreductase [Dehalococcoidia bacterium]